MESSEDMRTGTVTRREFVAGVTGAAGLATLGSIAEPSDAQGSVVSPLIAQTSSPASAAGSKPNIVFILADNVGHATSARTAGENCGGVRRRVSTRWRAKDCGSPNIWSSQRAHRRAQR